MDWPNSRLVVVTTRRIKQSNDTPLSSLLHHFQPFTPLSFVLHNVKYAVGTNNSTVEQLMVVMRERTTTLESEQQH